MSGFLEIKDLSRSFGRIKALDSLSLSIPKNAIAAFVGANGAGKTTTFSAIGGFIKPAKGTIHIGGNLLKKYKRSGGIIGLLPQDVQFYENRSLYRQLYLFSRLSGLAGKAAEKETYRVLEAVSLLDRARDRAAQLSRGMKMRLGVAQALVGSPPLLLLDEPTAGLDPKMLVSFRKLIQSLKGTTTIMISSHNLRELEDLCNYVCIIDQGRLVRQGPMQDFLHGTSELLYRLDKPIPSFQQLVTDIPNIEFRLRDELNLIANFDTRRFHPTTVNRKVISWLFEKEVEIFGVQANQSLEDRYLEALESKSS